MPFNGSGTYNPPSAPTFPAIPNTTIESTKYNNVVQDLATALSNCMTRDGQSPCTADIPLGGFKIENLGTGVLDTDAANVGQSLVPRGSIGASDWDTLLKLGVYEGVAASLTGPAANFPPTTEIGQLLVFPQGGNIVQVYHTTTSIWNRQKIGSTWSTWAASPVVISSNLTLSVPSVYPTVTAAMAFLGQRTIGRGVTVTIQMAAGTITEPATVSLNHPQGGQIAIVGAGIGSTIWDITAGANPGIVSITEGNKFGSISSLRLLGLAGKTGLLLENNAFLENISLVNFNTLTNGMRVDDNSVIGLVSNCTETSLTVLLTMQNNSYAQVSGVSSTKRVSVENSILVWASGGMNGATGDGFTLTRGSTMIVTSSFTCQNCTADGIQCDDGSRVIVVTGQTLTLSGNTGFGINYTNGSQRAIGTLAGAGGGSGLESAALRISGGAISASTGPLTLTPGAGDNVQFGTFTAAADAASTGYIEIKDSGGTIRRVMVRA